MKEVSCHSNFDKKSADKVFFWSKAALYTKQETKKMRISCALSVCIYDAGLSL